MASKLGYSRRVFGLAGAQALASVFLNLQLTCRIAQPGWFLSDWLSAHIADADRLGKPLILSEYGFSSIPAVLRDAFYAQALESVEASLSRGGAACGAAFWALYSDADRSLTRADPYAVFADDAVYAKVRAHAGAMASLAQAASRCGPGQ